MHALWVAPDACAPPPNPLNKTLSSNRVSHSPKREYELKGTKKEKAFCGAVWIVAFGHETLLIGVLFFPQGGRYEVTSGYD